MKKFDFLWITVLLVIAAILIVDSTRAAFLAATKAHPYLMGFIKVAILATMGELLALRIVSGEWKKPAGLVYRIIIWGFLGVTFVLVFVIFNGGTAASISSGLLPAIENETGAMVLLAFFTSAFMNLIFAPTFMAFHRITDTYIDMGNGKMSEIMKIKLKDVVSRIDWNGFISFVVCRTIPIFWIPAHTITFILPSEYRVLMASFLSIAMGGILAFAKRKAVKPA
ncbi:MAG: hypothetical protein ACOZCL_02280 [Bacillota bacterium]